MDESGGLRGSLGQQEVSGEAHGQGHALRLPLQLQISEDMRTMVQSDPRFKNLGSGCKSLELCADVVSDVGIKVKSRHLRFL